MRRIFISLIILLIFCSTSHASLLLYSVEENPQSHNPYRLDTPIGTYQINLSGSIWINSEPTIVENPPGGGDVVYNYEVSSFAVNFEVPEIGEILSFAGTSDSRFTVYTSTNNPEFPGQQFAAPEVCLTGSGAFELLWWSYIYSSQIDNTDYSSLPYTILIDDEFYGSGALEGWSAPVMGRDGWTLLGGSIKLTRQMPVPEPASLLLWLSGFILYNFAKRKSPRC